MNNKKAYPGTYSIVSIFMTAVINGFLVQAYAANYTILSSNNAAQFNPNSLKAPQLAALDISRHSDVMSTPELNQVPDVNKLNNGTSTAPSTVAEAPVITDNEPPLPPLPSDPYEGFNRAMFTFNDKIDTYFLKPLATFYNKIMPKPLNEGIHNVFFNIDTLPTIADDLLQAHFYQAANDIWRVGINTTIGIGGLFDVASRMNLPPYTNDFGLTLATWGYTQSNYLVLPFFGPNTVRDAIGLPVDYYAFSIYPYIHPRSTRYEIYAWAVLDRRAQLLKFQNVFEEAALDKYAFVRSAYLQRRAHQIEINKHRSCCDQKQLSTASTASGSSDNYD